MQSIIDPKLLERLRVGPLAQYLDPYLARIGEEGFSPSSVPCQAYAITRFSKWLQQNHILLKDINGPTIQAFLNRDAGVVHYPERASIHRLVAILRDIGVLRPELAPPLTLVQECMREYRQYLVLQRGLSLACLPNYLSYVEQFLQEKFGERELRFSNLRASDVTGFMKSHVTKLSPGRAKLLVTALRSFLRYLLHQGKITVDLSSCVLPVACWSYSEIPKSLPPGVVEQVLARCNRKTPIGRRNYAILLLLARLGLRAGEVVALNLEDLDWDSGLIRIRRKGNRWTQLPLQADVGAAIAAYLRSDRPFSSSRRVFLRHRAPARGFAGTPHVLRHTAAMELLQAGVDRAVIALWLGHESVETTQIYLDADLALKEQALNKASPVEAKKRRFQPDDNLLAFLKKL
jgi:site-specific recombinase XerD